MFGGFGNSVVKLGKINSALSVLDYFAPSNTLAENAIDRCRTLGDAFTSHCLTHHWTRCSWAT